MTTRFGVFVPQGWRMDLAEIEDPIEQFEIMTRVARAADEVGGILSGSSTTSTPCPRRSWRPVSRPGPSARRWRGTPRTSRSGRWSAATVTAIRRFYAKMASTVDVASHGRLYAGIGAGWYEHEWRAYGYGFPELRDRMGMFREACEIIHRMWTEDYPRFDGKYYTIDAPINEPKGVQKPHPSFWIGGGGERVTLKLVARWGDACNVTGSVPGDVDTIRHKLDVLKRHCEDLGGDYDEIIKSTSVKIHVVDDMSNAEQATAAARGDRPYNDYATGTIVGTPEMMKALTARDRCRHRLLHRHHSARSLRPGSGPQLRPRGIPRFD